MRLLAEFILRGRSQAAAIAFLGVLIFVPLLANITIGLVALRKGASEGSIALGAAFVANFILLAVGYSNESQQVYSLGAPLVTFAIALVLRATISWPFTTYAAVVASGVIASAMVLVQPEVTNEISSATQKMMESIAANNEEPQGEVPENLREVLGDFTAVKTAGLFAFFTVWTALISLFIARWMQSWLFNPGGFQEEFHRLRLTSPATIAFVFAALCMEYLGFEYAFWSSLCISPLMLAGISLVHYFCKAGGLGYRGLFAYYGLLLIGAPIVILITVFAGVCDTWLDLRTRFQFKGQS